MLLHVCNTTHIKHKYIYIYISVVKNKNLLIFELPYNIIIVSSN